VQEKIGFETIEKKMKEVNSHVNERMKTMENVVLLGNNELERVPIYSFMVKF